MGELRIQVWTLPPRPWPQRILASVLHMTDDGRSFTCLATYSAWTMAAAERKAHRFMGGV